MVRGLEVTPRQLELPEKVKAKREHSFPSAPKFWPLGSRIGTRRDPAVAVRHLSEDWILDDKQRFPSLKAHLGPACGACGRPLSPLRPGRFRQRGVERHQCQMTPHGQFQVSGIIDCQPVSAVCAGVIRRRRSFASSRFRSSNQSNEGAKASSSFSRSIVDWRLGQRLPGTIHPDPARRLPSSVIPGHDGPGRHPQTT
jgi:hypothetical protein